MLRRLALVIGCAVAFNAAAQGLFDDNEARRRIDLLRAEVSENQRQVAEQLKKMEAALAAASDRSALIQLATQVENLSNEMARMRGQLEVLANQAETADRRQKDLYLDIDTRLRKLEQARESTAAPDKPAAPAEAEASQGEMKAYQAALDQFKLGNYALAVSAMQGFLVTYPNSKLAPNAQYWVAIAVALLGASALHLGGVIDLSKSIYTGPNFTWLSYIVGGLLFGVGMTLGSGCGSKTLIRVGAGNLKSLIVYVFLGIAAYMTLRGVLGAFRVGVLEEAVITLPAGGGVPSFSGGD